MEARKPVWSTQTKLIVALVVLVIVGFLLYKFSEILTPFILAIVLAYILSPVVNSFQKRLHLGRMVAILFTYLLLILFLAAALRLVIPLLMFQFRRINVDLLHVLREARLLFGQSFTVAGVTVDGTSLLEQASGSLQAILEPVFGSTLGVLADILSSLAWVVFIIIISIYLIKDSEALRKWLESLPPPDYRQDFIRLGEEINNLWSSFFRGQLILSFVVTLIFITVSFVIGLHFALLMGVLAGLLEFFPSIGHGIWIVIASILALVLGSYHLPVPNWAFFLVLIGIDFLFTQFDINYLIPRIIGRRVNLPPLVIILGIIAGASLVGVPGVVLAAPTIATLRVLARYIYARLFDMEPFPDTSLKPMPPPTLRWWHLRPVKKKRPEVG
ncbi:MAG: AI-2E family transporter [Chloroflexi bacterium]|nr:AI-2E family transporter [Chloroflexota bacterium]